MSRAQRAPRIFSPLSAVKVFLLPPNTLVALALVETAIV
jgi:hypothetical protein